jgi:hypothetical protein
MEYAAHAPETWTIDDPSKAMGTSHVFGEMTMKIIELKLDGKEAIIRGAVAGIPIPSECKIDGDMRRHMSNSLMNKVFSGVSSDGKDPLTVASTAIENMDENSTTLSYGFTTTLKCESGADQNSKIQATFPTMLGEVWINFEFKDIELP